jgi:acetyltransferase-like isoleucine patch superfamily enzyme
VNPDRTLPGDWFAGRVPENVEVHAEAYLETTYSFQLFRSRREAAVRIGRGSSIYLGVMFDLGPEARLSVGEFTLINGARIICEGEASIGDYCLISWNTVLMDSYRLPKNIRARRRELKAVPQRTPRRFDADAPVRPLRLADNVWLGFDSCVFPGVQIGEGSVVGARSVVIEDVPPYTVVAGNPARIIRRLDPGERSAASELRV